MGYYEACCEIIQRGEKGWNKQPASIQELYNENNELLVVGKLGQPIRKSSKTDTTFIVRYDT